MGAEAAYKPFEVVEEDGRTVLRLHGTEEQRAKVEADKVHLIMDAIAQRWDIHVLYADIDGDLDIRKIANELEKTKDDKLVTKDNIWMSWCNISGFVNFESAHFIGDAHFYSTQFSGNASFWSAQFSGSAGFYSTRFGDNADFSYAQFSGNAYFGNVFMTKPANFAEVTFRENHVLKGLWNVTLGRIGLHRQVTNFSGFNTERAMDGASNPWLKRYVDDELWIQSWRRHSYNWWREPLFIIWELTSHCGRSIGLWAFWSALIAVLFGVLYAQYPFPSWLSWIPGLKWLLTSIPHPELYITPRELDAAGELIRETTGFTPYYFSIVTFTTLGFGDVTPLNLAGEVWLAIEVVLGYVMLGGLISIFANKLDSTVIYIL